MFVLGIVYGLQMLDFQYSYSNVIAEGEMRWQWFCISRETCCNGQIIALHSFFKPCMLVHTQNVLGRNTVLEKGL